MNSRNYGETLSYWYLRLNGFFPLPNFVVHQGNRITRTADCDFLAIRFPHVFEEIGGQGEDWDSEFFETIGIPYDQNIIALIVEVKTGYEQNPNSLVISLSGSFSKERLSYGIKRFGFWSPEKVDEIVKNHLEKSPSFHDNNNGIYVAKLLISTYYPKSRKMPPCHFLGLDYVDHFIRERMNYYRDRKQPDRYFFPDDLIQYIIWRG